MQEGSRLVVQFLVQARRSGNDDSHVRNMCVPKQKCRLFSGLLVLDEDTAARERRILSEGHLTST